MKTFGWVLVAAAVGCAAPQVPDGAWMDAGSALQDRGVFFYRVETTADAAVQAVALRGPSAESVGRLEIGAGVVSLSLGATAWRQEIAADTGEMTLTLDGQRATLRWDGGAWQGDARGRDLLAQSQPLVELVRLVGVEAKLTPSAPPPYAPVLPKTDAGWPGKPDAGPAQLACSDAAVTGSGWAWYWETGSQELACGRANDAAQSSCELSTGVGCCNVEKSCAQCANWGTGWACKRAAHLQQRATAP